MVETKRQSIKNIKRKLAKLEQQLAQLTNLYDDYETFLRIQIRRQINIINALLDKQLTNG
jgi:hypothetical protein